MVNRVRIIKKYLNRKLYDTVASKYITIAQIADMLKNDIDLKVLDNETGEDITNVVMAKVIVDREVKSISKNEKDKKTLKDIITTPGESIHSYINKTKKNVKEELDRLIKKNDISVILKYLQGIYDTSYKSISLMIDEKINDFDELVKEKMNNLYPVNILKDINKMKKEIKELKTKIKNIEGKLDE